MSIRIPVAAPSIGPAELRLVTQCMKSGWISSIGPFVAEFEAAMAQATDTRYAIATANGTVAIHLALEALGIGKGDEVIVPDLTFVATANAVKYTGAKVVLADVDPVSWNLSPEAVEKKITRRTKAIVPVHLYGHPADMDAFRAMAKRHGVFLVEDAAEALGATWRGKPAGSMSGVGTFSFYANKTVTTGEGGMCVTNDRKLAERMRFLRDHAMSPARRYFHPEVGFNYRLTGVQSAIGLAQLRRLEEFLDKKRAIAAWYRAGLEKVEGLVLPPEHKHASNSYWLYSVLVTPAFGQTRDELAAALREEGIDSRRFFYPLHQMPPYASREKFPIADSLAEQGLSLPSSTLLKKSEVRTVTAAIAAAQRRARR